MIKVEKPFVIFMSILELKGLFEKNKNKSFNIITLVSTTRVRTAKTEAMVLDWRNVVCPLGGWSASAQGRGSDFSGDLCPDEWKRINGCLPQLMSNKS